MRMKAVVRTLKIRGGRMGERFVMISFTVASRRRATPQARGAIVCGVDPEYY